ncbi:unnamed protein product [Spirodela intermedia]|uniref:Uncharacterized protein n=1 Tax=Spirodela intermedia TaxID=51605 RepID=A0A7I8IQS7_SPIIN|nr:unnamed protein product [Spirodela intermedia]CAA6659886.1 unnamed protein product [Spirodela intermedia]
MLQEGTLARMKTREKKFRPIAAHVNASHHALDPVAFPFQWSWKDASTKVQNMRHQYLLVKQKLLSSCAVVSAKAAAAVPAPADADRPDFPWDDGPSHWANFLRYKDVFGDVPLPSTGAADAAAPGPGSCFAGDRGRGQGPGISPTPSSPPPPPPPPPLPAQPALLRGAVSRKKRRKKMEGKALAFMDAQIVRLKEREARLDEWEAEQEGERQRRELTRVELEEREQVRQQMRRQLEEDWEDRWRRQQEEDREWEQRAESRRLEWKKNIEGMLNQHRIEMDQMQARVLHVQQSMIAQIVGLVAQWSVPNPQSGPLSDGAGFPNHHGHHHHHQVYVSQMMQNLHHVNGIVHGDNRVDGESQDDQFIVDDG